MKKGEIDPDVRFLRPADLAERWQLSLTTVMSIPRDELPFMAIGTGRLKRRRRYHPDDVAAYEAGKRRDRPS